MRTASGLPTPDEPCHDRPCILETKLRESGEWKACSFSDERMTTPTVYECHHQAMSDLGEMLVAVLRKIAAKEMPPDELPKPSEFRVVYVDKVPKEHELPEGDNQVITDEAKAMIKAMRRAA